MKRQLLALACLAALLPLVAQAHVETFSQQNSIIVGPYTALVQLQPEPVYSNSILTMSAIYSRLSDGSFDPRVNATLTVVAPDGTNRTNRMEPDGRGYLVASVLVKTAGNYSARISIRDGGVTHENATTFIAYPDLAVRIRTADADQSDPLVGQEYTIAVETIGNVSLLRVDTLRDLTLHLERWSDDHKTLYGTQVLDMTRTEPGVWSVKHVFNEKGMAHLRFSSRSGGFMPDDVPILHVYASEPAGTPVKKETPGASLTLALVALGSLALLLRRR